MKSVIMKFQTITYFDIEKNLEKYIRSLSDNKVGDDVFLIEDIETILTMMRKGATVEEISKELGTRNYMGIRQIKFVLEKKFRKEEIEEILFAYNRIYYWDFLQNKPGMPIRKFYKTLVDYLKDLPLKEFIALNQDTTKLLNIFYGDIERMHEFLSYDVQRMKVKDVELYFNFDFNLQAKVKYWLKMCGLKYSSKTKTYVLLKDDKSNEELTPVRFKY